MHAAGVVRESAGSRLHLRKMLLLRRNRKIDCDKNVHRLSRDGERQVERWRGARRGRRQWNMRLIALLVIRSSGWFAVARRQTFLDGDDMESSDCDARVIVEPDNYASPTRIEASVIGALHGITLTAAGHDGKGFKGRGFQMLTNITNHAPKYSHAARFRQSTIRARNPAKGRCGCYWRTQS